ncbi:uncharacterized protein LOC118438628 [Folsomia candida]|uniref:uncharacterized protein LOC118438628 n=1 Tax=Folsomia candida TaxID=158441 RepID=UPI00160528BB|nr:uncharacterized protein LOC118438628 [Folsomia candida]
MAMDIGKVSRILIQDETLVTNWEEFYTCLNFLDPDFNQLKNSYSNSTITTFTLFSTILKRWVSARGDWGRLPTLIQILKQNDFIMSAEVLESNCIPITTAPSDPVKPFIFQLGKSSPTFTGRHKQLALLQLFMKSRVTVAVTGLPGIGKTSLLRKFAWTVIEREGCSCIYLLGENSSTITTSIHKLGQLTSTPIRNEGTDELRTPAEILLSALSSLPARPSKKILLVIDNVDEINEIVASILRELILYPEKWFVLVTSRNVAVLSCIQDEIRLTPLDGGDAAGLIRGLLPDEKADMVGNLATLMDNFPLAIKQAVAYIRHARRIKNEKYSIQNYMAEFRIRKMEMLQQPLSPLDSEGYQLTSFTAIRMTVSKIVEDADGEGGMAEIVLKLASYLNPDKINFKFKKYLVQKISKQCGRQRWFGTSRIKNYFESNFSIFSP